MVINNTTTQVSFFPFVSFSDVAASGGGVDSYLLQQDGFFILQQDGSKIITATASDQVDVQVWHKQTKTMVEAQRDVTISGSKVTLTLPSLAAIASVAEDLDTLLLRVLYDGILKWEYLATWSTESVALNKEFKQWDEVTPTQPNWIKI
jgi:hypothetical protein